MARPVKDTYFEDQHVAERFPSLVDLRNIENKKREGANVTTLKNERMVKQIS